jgi:general secretion pathway protein D
VTATNVVAGDTNVPAAAPTQPPAPAAPAPTDPAAQTVAPTATPPPAAAAPPPEEMIPTGMISWTAADLNQVLTIYAELVGRTILRPANLASAPIVLKAQTPLTKREAIQALEAVLALNGIEMIPMGEKFVKAMPIAQANAAGAVINTNDASQLPALGSYVTHVVQTKYMKPTELQAVITPFASMATAVLPIDASGIIVLRDNTENVKRMLEMIERVDIAVPSEFISEVIPIKYAKVEDIASALNSLSGGASGTTVGARSTGGGTTTPGLNRPGYNPNQPGGQFGQPGTLGTPTAGTPSGGGTFSDRLNAIIKKAASTSGDLQIIGVTKIVADARSNSLLIFASRQDMTMIKDIVSKLDVVLAQVLIETIIMDVSLDDSWAFGVSAGQYPKTSGKATVGGVYNNPSGTPLDTLSQFFSKSSGSNVSSIFPGSDGLSYFGRWNGDLDVAVQALASDNRINVIQKPRIQTSHATDGHIFIGNTVPYVSGTYYGGGFGGGPGSSYQQLRVGIDLTVTPFINQDGLVVMKIQEAIDEISGSTAIQGVGAVPNTTSRTLTAEVAVKDRETIILGGFIRNSDSKGKSGVPLLKDIPLLGALFSSRTSAKERKELIVLMRPTVLRTPEIAAAQVIEEKRRLPGVRAAEAENDELERKNWERDQKRAFKEKRHFTPEEVKLYGEPPATTAP